MKEVKYMQQAGYENIPAIAKKISDEKETFRRNLIFLDQIAHLYNKVLNSSNAVEHELLSFKVKAIDATLQDGITKIRWSNPSDRN